MEKRSTMFRGRSQSYHGAFLFSTTPYPLFRKWIGLQVIPFIRPLHFYIAPKRLKIGQYNLSYCIYDICAPLRYWDILSHDLVYVMLKLDFLNNETGLHFS